jgi:hypothetical protein
MVTVFMMLKVPIIKIMVYGDDKILNIFLLESCLDRLNITTPIAIEKAGINGIQK